MKLDVNCPCVICGGNRSSLVHEVDYRDQNYPGEFTLRRCLSCGLLFNSPRLDDASIAAMYDGNYYVFKERESKAVRRVANLLNRTIGVAQEMTPHRSVLEVGCAKGWLLALLRTQGWQVQGVELSVEAAKHARRALGLSVFMGTVESYVDRPDHLPSPVVVTTDVIEHVPDLDRFTAALARAVTPGGLLVIGTPNADSAVRDALGERWLGYNPFHIFLLSRSTLSTLLRRHGFVVIESYTFNNEDTSIQTRPDGFARRTMRKALDASGLLALARLARDSAGRALDNVLQPTQRMLAHTAAGLSMQTPFTQTDDGRSERRSLCTGDNLVIIARRMEQPS